MASRTAPELDRVFGALAHPVRRAMLDQLVLGDASVGELAAPHPMRLPTISRHLGVLEGAGLVSVDPDGRIRRRHLDASPLRAAAAYLETYRALWEARFDRLDTVLAEESAARNVGGRRRRR